MKVDTVIHCIRLTLAGMVLGWSLGVTAFAFPLIFFAGFLSTVFYISLFRLHTTLSVGEVNRDFDPIHSLTNIIVNFGVAYVIYSSELYILFGYMIPWLLINVSASILASLVFYGYVGIEGNEDE